MFQEPVKLIQGTTQIDQMNHSNWSMKTLKFFQKFTQDVTENHSKNPGNHSNAFVDINWYIYIPSCVQKGPNFGDLIPKPYFVRTDAIIGGGGANLILRFICSRRVTGAYYRSWKRLPKNRKLRLPLTLPPPAHRHTAKYIKLCI